MKRTILMAAIILMAVTSLKAQSQLDEAKAKFIYNFTKFFDWPQSERTGDFIIGVVGSNNVYQELDDFTEGKKVILQKIQVKKFRNAEDVTDCHVLYVSKYRTRDLTDIKNKMNNNTLLISDSQNGIQKGAALNFLLVGNRLKYEFAASNAMSQGLKFSSRIRDMAAKNY